MRYLALHSKVHVFAWRWLAVQVVLLPELSLGLRFEPRRPLLDLYFFALTVSIGRHPALTDPRVKHWDSCRGYIFSDAEQARLM